MQVLFIKQEYELIAESQGRQSAVQITLERMLPGVMV